MKINIRFECLDGYYYLDLNDNKYIVDTNIDNFDSVSGELTDDNYSKFKNIFGKTNICLWESKYEINGLVIEDSVKWSVKYTDDDNITYSSVGEEGYWPYEYDTLVDALMIIDKKIEFFRSNKEGE